MRQYLKKNNPKDGAAIHGCSWLCGVDGGDTEKCCVVDSFRKLPTGV